MIRFLRLLKGIPSPRLRRGDVSPALPLTAVVGLACLVACLVASPLEAESPEEDGFVALFDGKSLEGWKPVLPDKDDDPEKTWQIGQEGTLVCTGKPNGYLRSDRQYENYELSLEWRYVEDANGNSGVLLHGQMPDKVWPSCVEVQLHNPTAGTVFPLVDSKTNNELRVRDKSRPVGEWNTLAITCRDGSIAVVMNGEKVGEVTGSEPAKGYVALQSEGAEIHFRKIKIREAKPPAAEQACSTSLPSRRLSRRNRLQDKGLYFFTTQRRRLKRYDNKSSPAASALRPLRKRCHAKLSKR